jgi:hypothetical protein
VQQATDHFDENYPRFINEVRKLPDSGGKRFLLWLDEKKGAEGLRMLTDREHYDCNGHAEYFVTEFITENGKIMHEAGVALPYSKEIGAHAKSSTRFGYLSRAAAITGIVAGAAGVGALGTIMYGQAKYADPTPIAARDNSQASSASAQPEDKGRKFFDKYGIAIEFTAIFGVFGGLLSGLMHMKFNYDSAEKYEKAVKAMANTLTANIDKLQRYYNEHGTLATSPDRQMRGNSR